VNAHLPSPVVTVSMATCNSELTVARAVTSVLNQDFSNLELLVFDSQSSDQTREILRSFARRDRRIRLHLHEKRLPWTANAQLGLQLACGEFFMFLDGDDYVANNYLSQLIDRLKDESSIGAMGRLLHCNIEGQLLVNHPAFGRVFEFACAKHRRRRLHRMILTPDVYGAVNTLYSLWRTSELREVGLWTTEKERRDDDYLFCLRALSKGRIVTVSDTWICRLIEPYTGPKVESRESVWLPEAEMRTSHRTQIVDWTFPYLVQIVRFIRNDWRNLTLLLPVFVRMCVAIVALPKRCVRIFTSMRNVRSSHG